MKVLININLRPFTHKFNIYYHFIPICSLSGLRIVHARSIWTRELYFYIWIDSML
jgi:hypothetical protein